jgi:hypothetical protein
VTDYAVLAVDIKLRTRPTNIKLKAKLRKEREIEETQKIRIFYY